MLPVGRTLKIIEKMLPRVLRYRDFRRDILNDKQPSEEEMRREAKKFVDSIMELGPTFIKLGQLLSVRADVMPEPYLKELQRLQDEVTPEPFERVKGAIINDVPDLDSVEEVPIASASLGQVHVGRLRDGREVAIKVLRPDVRKLVEQDIAIVRALLPYLRFVFDTSLVESVKVIVDDFSKRIFEEMDYVKEAENIKRITDELSDFSRIRTPKVVRATKRVLVMEYLPGYKVTSDEASKVVDRRELAYRIFQVFMTMLLEKPLFHADPHPGNLAVDKEGNLILYDFGMVGSLDRITRRNLVRAYVNLIRQDPYGLVRILDQLGAIQPEADREVLAEGIGLFMKSMQGIQVDEMELQDFMKLADQVFYKFPLRLPQKMVLYMRMTNELEGICRTIDPSFDFIGVLTQFLEDEGLAREAMEEEVRDVVSTLTNRLRLSLLTQRRTPVIVGSKRSRNYLPQIVMVGAVVLYVLTRDEVLSILLALLGLSFVFTRS
ncbi:glycosyl transferase family 1 [Sulfodiicoccus acidiphilus]|uniref:Glycosyl transferase family 1 n=1 Tax=Sulfodiicoccus acidiphilus TaxID=1670455 RepID=A0A348B6T5_9CREN|nr:AarF/UbiB family protein [Sulfodiicoccus acidiphilus]BBD73887.1 glycosyl transferase family 1 [Sulfodiicoccus acidiphilus]GGT96089.1 glycosyl transferase family 1 [Sulfodiicoccus acidiphilus]